MQDRQSLLAHIILWLDGTPAEVDAICNEITACLPCDVDHDNNFDLSSLPTLPNGDPTAPQVLFHGSKRKNMHTCRPVGQYGCRKDKFCKSGFPGAVQLVKAALYDDVSMRYKYYRPRHCDRNVVPYHPLVALFWGAHTNIQRITASAWSVYLLKYAVKVSNLHRLLLLAPHC